MKMRRAIPISVLALALSGGPGSLDVAAQDNIAIVYRLLDDQQAMLEFASGDDFRLATPTDPLASNDRITTDENTRAAVKFLDGSLLRVDANSAATIRAETQGGSILRTVNLEFGELFASVQGQATDQPTFQVETPSGVAAVKGTEFIVRVDPITLETTVITIEGLLDFFTGAGTVEVPANFQASATSNDVPPNLSEIDSDTLEQYEGIMEDPAAGSQASTIEVPLIDPATGEVRTLVITVPQDELGALLGGGGE